MLNDVEQWTLLDPVYKAYTKDLCGYAERGEKEWKRLLGSFFAERRERCGRKNDEGQIEGYAVYRLVLLKFRLRNLYIQHVVLNVVCLIIFIIIALKVKAFAGMRGCMTPVIDLCRMEKQVIQRCHMMARIVDVETALTTVPVNPEAVMMPIT